MKKFFSGMFVATLSFLFLLLSGCGGGSSDSSMQLGSGCESYFNQIGSQSRIASNRDYRCYSQVDLADSLLDSAQTSCAANNKVAADATYLRYSRQATYAIDVTSQICGGPADSISAGNYYLLAYYSSSGSLLASVCTSDPNYGFKNGGGQVQLIASGLTYSACLARESQF